MKPIEFHENPLTYTDLYIKHIRTVGKLLGTSGEMLGKCWEMLIQLRNVDKWLKINK